MAAPHVTGLIALIMQIADESVAASDIQTALINNAIFDGSSWDPVFGYGRVDGVKTLKSFV